ncbi:protein rep, partial [Streptomyces sp. NPDC048350]|uniref:protein rep n=1 Tax=Streptomyces sp. NPDC048350 TaxID=3365538 RepID=UPI00372214E2
GGGAGGTSSGPAGRPLGTTTEFVSPPSAKSTPDQQEREDGYAPCARRRKRIELRRIVWSITGVKRLTACGKVLAHDSEKVTLKLSPDGVAYAAGLCVCANIWLCPVCSAKIRAGRADEIARGVAAHILSGGSSWMVTFTVRHARDHALAELLNALNDAFRRLGNGKAAQGETTRTGKVGTINAREITYGRNGWHPHLHVIVLFEAEPKPEALMQMMTRWQRIWLRWSEKHGFPANAQNGVKWDRVVTAKGAGEYIAKAQDSGKHIGNEVARGDLKKGKLGSLTPFELVEYFGKTGDLAAVDLWHEYEKATKGKAAISWSRGLKARLLGDETDPTDEDLAGAEQHGTEVAELPEASWKTIVRHGIEAEVFEAIERGGFAELVKLLAAHHVWAVKRPDRAERP